LQEKFEALLGSKNVYSNPPEGVKMGYPAIRFTLKDIDVKRANDSVYTANKCYEVTVIGRMPNDDIVAKILALPCCSYDRHYKASNLHHDVLTLYY
jgi:hypothetical protein